MPVPSYDFITEDLESVTIACDHMESLLREEIFYQQHITRCMALLNFCLLLTHQNCLSPELSIYLRNYLSY